MGSFVFKSERQIQTDIVNRIRALLGIDDINPGSVLDVTTASVAQEIFAEYIQMSQIVRLVDLDSITGDDLDDKAFEYGLTRAAANKTTGKVNILRPASFTKVSTTLYAGSAAPIIGNTTINVNDASDVLYSTSGTLILGRGTDNEEEAAYSVPPVDNTNFWTFTLDAGLVNNHNVEETVILKQGSDEIIVAGTVIVVPATSTSTEIQYTTNTDVTLLAGEESIEDVDITASEAGIIGNISTGRISGSTAFTTPPFSGVRAANTTKFTTGSDRQSDDELRDAIKDHIQSLSNATKQAILNAIVGLVDTETAKRVVSASVILPQDTNTPVKIYIDDGGGFEPSFLNRGFETIINDATGGELRLQLDIIPVVKAQVETTAAENYDMSGGSKTLIYTVGIESETMQFDTSDFEFPESGTAEEIVVAINDGATLIEARTSSNGTKVVITSRVDVNEDIQVTGGTANSILGFPTDKRSSLYLYIDDELQSKDGETARLDSGNQSPYNFNAINAGGNVVLNLIVDGKTVNPQTVTFTPGDFSDYAACTTAEVAVVINAQLAGTRAELINNDTQIRLISNIELNSLSIVEVTGGNANHAVNGLNFDTTAVAGANGEYTLNRELGTIELSSSLSANQIVTAGSQFTRAKLRAGNAENYAPNNGETLIISVDAGANQTVTFDASFALGLSAAATATFINLQLDGATAIVREIGSINYLEIRTNTQTEATGSIEIKNTSTANATFGFTLESVQSNQRPHKSYRESGNAGPFSFVEEDSLVVVIDNNIVDNTYSVGMNFAGVTTSGTSDKIFVATAFSNIFQSDSILNDFYCAFLDGANTKTVTALISSVTNPGGSTFRYNFSAPQTLSAFAVNDLIKLTGLTENENNGFFLLTAVDGAGNYIEVTNADGIVEAGSTGTSVLSERRQITAYATATGTITVGVSYTATPSAADNFIVLPSTIKNLTYYMNNTKISSISLKAVIEGVVNNTKLQISSQSAGSDGYVQVTGGGANNLLNFSTSLYRGLQAYSYYTGLLELVHRTIYGDDTDLVSYPGIGAAGIKFQVLAPTNHQISVSVNVDLSEGISLSQIENEITSAITGYINSLGVGEDVIIEEIRAAVIAIDGITDVILNTPTSNTAIADNETARIRSNNITIG